MHRRQVAVMLLAVKNASEVHVMEELPEWGQSAVSLKDTVIFDILSSVTLDLLVLWEKKKDPSALLLTRHTLCRLSSCAIPSEKTDNFHRLT